MQGKFVDEQILCARFVALCKLGTDRRKGAERRRDLKVIVAVDTRNFLDQVSLDRDVLGGAPARNGDGEAVAAANDAEAERREGCFDFVERDIDARVTVNVRLVDREGDRVLMGRINVGERRGDLDTAVDLHQESEEALRGKLRHFGIECLLVTHACVGTQAEAR